MQEANKLGQEELLQGSNQKSIVPTESPQPGNDQVFNYKYPKDNDINPPEIEQVRLLYGSEPVPKEQLLRKSNMVRTTKYTFL